MEKLRIGKSIEEKAIEIFKQTIADNGWTSSFIAAKLALTPLMFHRKLNGESPLKVSDFVNICEVLGLNAKQELQKIINSNKYEKAI